MLFKLISILFEGLLTENVYKKGMTELDIKLKEGWYNNSCVIMVV
jgi:hypothetical protein